MLVRGGVRERRAKNIETAIATGFAVKDVLDGDPALWEAGRFRE